MKHLSAVCAALGVSALFVSFAWAERNPPKKANKHQVSLVQAVEACAVGSANTTEPGILAIPACDPVVPSDSGCVFGAKGAGRIKAKSKTDIALQVKVKGVDAGCDGQQLCLAMDFTSVRNNCASAGDCCHFSRA